MRIGIDVSLEARSASFPFSGNFLSVLPGAFQIMVSDQGVTNGGTMTRADQSGNGKSYSATTTQPTTAGSLNGRSTLLFNGSTQTMASALALAAPGTTPWECVFVCRQITWVAGGRLISSANDPVGVLYNSGASAPQISTFAVGGLANNNLTLGVWSLVKIQCTNSAADSLQVGNTAAVTGAGFGNLATTGQGLGGSGGFFANVEVAMIAYGPNGFSGAPFRAALDAYYAGLVLHP